jgi:ATP-dependent DNA ligase
MLLKPPLPPMEARSAEEVPAGNGWQYEPKWDGFRCIAFRDGRKIYLQSKAGQPLARYFPDIVEALAGLPAQQFIIDGELVIPIRSAFSFNELQLRLHPAASRVQKLAKAHPAMFIIFDLLGKDRQSYVERSLKERRDMLEEFARENFETKSALRLSPATTNLTTAKKWFAKVGGNLDGVIAKELNASYACGERIALVNGNRSIPRSWSKLPMIILPAADFGTAQGSCDGGRTKRLVNARRNRWNIAKANRLPSCDGRMRQQAARTPSS